LRQPVETIVRAGVQRAVERRQRANPPRLADQPAVELLPGGAAIFGAKDAIEARAGVQD
jgi:D-aminopeptidase